MLGRWDSVCIQKTEMVNLDFDPLALHPLLPPRGHCRDHTGGLRSSCHVIDQSSGFAAGHYHRVLLWALPRVCPSSPRPEVALFPRGMSRYVHVHVGVGVYLPWFLPHQQLGFYSAPVSLPEIAFGLHSLAQRASSYMEGQKWHGGDKWKLGWMMEVGAVEAKQESCHLWTAACARAPACLHHPLPPGWPFLHPHPCTPPRHYQGGGVAVTVTVAHEPGLVERKALSLRTLKTWAVSAGK